MYTHAHLHTHSHTQHNTNTPHIQNHNCQKSNIEPNEFCQQDPPPFRIFFTEKKLYMNTHLIYRARTARNQTSNQNVYVYVYIRCLPAGPSHISNFVFGQKEIIVYTPHIQSHNRQNSNVEPKHIGQLDPPPFCVVFLC